MARNDLRLGGASDGLAEYAALMVLESWQTTRPSFTTHSRWTWPRLKQLGLDLGLVEPHEAPTRRRINAWPSINVVTTVQTMSYLSMAENHDVCRLSGFPYRDRGRLSESCARSTAADHARRLSPANARENHRGRPFDLRPPLARRVQIDAYQLQSSGEYAGYVAGSGGSEPIYSARPIKAAGWRCWIKRPRRRNLPLGYELRPNPFGKIAPDGSNGLLLLKIRDGESEEYHFLRLYDCNLACLHGAKDEYLCDSNALRR